MRNEFLESIKADKATIEKCNRVSREAKIRSMNNSKEGGKSRADMFLGRESGAYKSENTASQASGKAGQNNGEGHSNSSGNISAGHISAGHISTGHSSCG